MRMVVGHPYDPDDMYIAVLSTPHGGELVSAARYGLEEIRKFVAGHHEAKNFKIYKITKELVDENS